MSNEINTIIKEKAKEIFINTVKALLEEPYNTTIEELGMALAECVDKEELIKGLNAGTQHEGVQRVEEEGA